MKEKYSAYLDGFNRITIIYPKKLITNEKEKQFFILIEDEMLKMDITSIDLLANDYKFSCILPETVALNVEYSVVDEKSISTPLRSGSIVRTDLFEMLYFYSGNLGFDYSPSHTTFRVWSPVAKEIELELIDLNGHVRFYDLTSFPRGLWEVDIIGDLDGYKYRFRVRNGLSFKTCLDPYAISSSANAEYNYVIDLNKTYQFKYPKPEYSGKMVDAVIYELHIRDYTIAIKNKNSGKYLGMIEDFNTPFGVMNAIQYIKNLGITHVQLQPIYDFGGVDEKNPDVYYNWGYNPVQYNVPEGWFASNPDDPYCRINELKMLIDEFHKEGIRVVMDVVYNHVYDYKTFPLEVLVPGYFFRFDDNGNMTNVSGCKNDFATERKMASRFIVDSTKYWIEEFGLDGFRFDLMGLIDIETINNVYSAMKAFDSKTIMYGEGWNMPANIPDNMRANMNNHYQLPNVGFFNDRFRNIIKGNQWDRSLGYASGGLANYLDILYLVTGSCVDNYLFNSPNQSINYVECHDNYTFFDSLKVLNKLTDQEIEDSARLALSMVIISQGVPFIHAGEEFYRTKYLDENSYQSPDKINQIRWDEALANSDFIYQIRDLIAIRKAYKGFRYDRRSLIKERIKIDDIDGYLRCLKLSIKSIDANLIIVIKNNSKYDYIDFKGRVSMIFDGEKACDQLLVSKEIRKKGIYIFRRSE